MVVRGGGGIAERKSENLWPFIVLWAPMWLWHNGPPGGNNTRRLRRCLKHSPYNVINDTAFPPPRPLRKEHRSFDDQNLIELAYPTSVKTRSLRRFKGPGDGGFDLSADPRSHERSRGCRTCEEISSTKVISMSTRKPQRRDGMRGKRGYDFTTCVWIEALNARTVAQRRSRGHWIAPVQCMQC